MPEILHIGENGENSSTKTAFDPAQSVIGPMYPPYDFVATSVAIRMAAFTNTDWRFYVLKNGYAPANLIFTSAQQGSVASSQWITADFSTPQYVEEGQTWYVGLKTSSGNGNMVVHTFNNVIPETIWRISQNVGGYPTWQTWPGLNSSSTFGRVNCYLYNNRTPTLELPLLVGLRTRDAY